MNPLALGAVGGILLFGGLTVARFERDAANDLKSRLVISSETSVSVRTRLDLAVLDGEIAGLTVHAHDFETNGLPIHTEPEHSKRGRIRHLTLDLEHFLLTGLPVESLVAKIDRCRFDLAYAAAHHRLRLTRSGAGTIEVRLKDSDLAVFVKKKYPNLSSVSIQILDGKVHVWGEGQFLFAHPHFDVTASAEIQEGGKLVLTGATIAFDGKIQSPEATQSLLKTL
ncbi:MAG TPA: hypothetical protein VG944_02585, partial [Fimbriimonas sp.]|nr:hypothetical protein [Fimbriimonas sp.]